VTCALILAALRLAAPFTDGAVLQRDMKVPVWGTTEAGEKVKVEFAGQVKETTAAADGSWRIDLDPMKASSEGRELVVTSAHQASPKTRTVRDVLVGEVWLCSGQSNMGIPFWSDSPRARDRYGYQVGQITTRPTLRFAYLGNSWSDVPLKDEDVAWRKATPEYLVNGGFSAVAVWYGLYLQGALGVPVGLFGAYVGATDIETWTPDCPTPCPESRKDQDGQKPSQYHNGKVAPICPYAMRGAIWYQGESNTAKTEIPKYAGKMRDLLNGWKRVFENPRYKIYFAQLCPWGNPLVPLMQEEQEKFARSEPDAGMAVLCDVGNLHDIHPNDKETVGLRLALLALKRDYGFDKVIADSPTLETWRVEDGKFVMKFRDVKKWSIYDPDWRIHRDPSKSAEYGFEVAGEDGKWVKAEIGNIKRLPNVKHVEYRGQITNEELVVFSPLVNEPKSLRYLHSEPWRGYLLNEAGLPVGAFHIGDLDAEAAAKKKAAAGTMKPVANY